jgi:hypothetical protein
MMILEGTINGMRPVSGEVTQGKNKGSYWHFLSMEVCEPRFGQIYSCQVRMTEKDLFNEFVKVEKGKDKNGNDGEVGRLLKDLTGHQVKLLIKGASAGERIKTTPAPAPANPQARGAAAPAPIEEVILQVRFYVAGLKDQGMPKTDDF